jgi:DNA-binding MarR family transcriptional regulator
MPADFVARVMQLVNLLVRRLGTHFDKAPVTPQQWLVLLALEAEGAAVTPVTLARRMSVTKQNMTGMVARLEQLGLTERHDDPTDLRATRVQLTRRGKALLDRLRPGWNEWLQQMAEEIGEKEMQALMQNVERLIDSLEHR